MPHPVLPAPFVLVVVPAERAVVDDARRRCRSEPEHGLVLLAERRDRLEAALVLVPERPREIALSFAPVALLGLYRALAAVLPPVVPLQIRRPLWLLLDGAPLGDIVVDIDPTDPPGWMILGLNVPIQADAIAATDLAAVGAGDVRSGDLLQGFCRHLLPLADAFEEDGLMGLAPHWNALAATPSDRLEPEQ